jgi:hypothetical protein
VTAGVRLWHADTPPPERAFDRAWQAVRDVSPRTWVAFADVDDVDTAGAAGPGRLWRQVFPAAPVPAPPPGAVTALMVVFSRPEGLSDDEFNAWYDTDHLPPLMTATVPRVRRFHRDGEEYPYLALYEISDWDAWEAHPGRAVARGTAWMARVRQHMARTEGYYSPHTIGAVTGQRVGGAA